MNVERKRIVCLGEAMVELAPHHGRWNVHYGGDTLNTALHLTRLGHDVAYLTALGDDPFAGTMRSAWGREALDVSLVLTVPERRTGLYAISTDERGERHFSYWRGESAARALFAAADVDRALEQAHKADLLFISLISLAILPETGRERVLALAAEIRARGGQLAFDGNYRPPLWESAEAARRWRDRAADAADFGFPSLDDEAALGVAGGAAAVREHWLRQGCGEVLVKLGAEGVTLPDGAIAPPPSELRPLDTSGAGDAFDAGYLASRLRGASAEQAVRDGQRLAGWTLMRQGAIPPRDHAAPYAEIIAGYAEV
jgi:2-dehydro-3-deoxygluconokinase